MKGERRNQSPYERIMDEIAREELAQLKAVQDYNIMMGILEDPEEGEEARIRNVFIPYKNGKKP